MDEITHADAKTDAELLAIAACSGVAYLAQIVEQGLGHADGAEKTHAVMRKFLEAFEGADGPQAAILRKVFSRFDQPSA